MGVLPCCDVHAESRTAQSAYYVESNVTLIGMSRAAFLQPIVVAAFSSTVKQHIVDASSAGNNATSLGDLAVTVVDTTALDIHSTDTCYSSYALGYIQAGDAVAVSFVVATSTMQQGQDVWNVLKYVS